MPIYQDMETGILIKNDNIEALTEVAKQIIENYRNDKLFLLNGKMGAGKTTLIKELCKMLNVTDVVNSPTFSIVNEYKTIEGRSVFHFDLYRIKSPTELMDIGYEEYLYGDSICFIEWPELAIDLLPESFISIHIDVDEQSADRIIHVIKSGNN